MSWNRLALKSYVRASSRIIPFFCADHAAGPFRSVLPARSGYVGFPLILRGGGHGVDRSGNNSLHRIAPTC